MEIEDSEYIRNLAVDITIELREKISQCWGKDTSFDGTFNGSRGQCYVTALLLSKVFKDCKVVHGWIKHNGKREHHFFNEIDGFAFDFTSDQYGGDGYRPVITEYKVYDKPNYKNKRYLKLLKRYEEFENQKTKISAEFKTHIFGCPTFAIPQDELEKLAKQMKGVNIIDSDGKVVGVITNATANRDKIVFDGEVKRQIF